MSTLINEIKEFLANRDKQLLGESELSNLTDTELKGVIYEARSNQHSYVRGSVLDIENANKIEKALSILESRSVMPLRGHSYHTKSDAELKYIIKDAGEAAKANKNGQPGVEGKYLDQMNDASTVLYYRNKGGLKQVKESELIEAAPAPSHKVGDTVWARDSSNKAQVHTGKVLRVGNALTRIKHKDGTESEHPHKDVAAEYETLSPNKNKNKSYAMQKESEELKHAGYKNFDDYVDTVRTENAATGRKITESVKEIVAKALNKNKEGISAKKETKFHEKLDSLVHDTFGKRTDESNKESK
jgi:hypothetical protein